MLLLLLLLLLLVLDLMGTISPRCAAVDHVPRLGLPQLTRGARGSGHEEITSAHAADTVLASLHPAFLPTFQECSPVLAFSHPSCLPTCLPRMFFHAPSLPPPLQALYGNGLVAIMKFLAYGYTGSGAMLSEASTA